MPSSNGENSLSDTLIEVLKLAIEIPEPHFNKIDMVVYSINTYPPAHQFYLSASHSGINIHMTDPIQASLHILPYKEDVKGIVAFVAESRDNYIINLAQASYSLNVPLRLYGPPMHPAYEEKLDELDVDRIVIEYKAPIFLMTLASLFWLLKRLPEARKSRLSKEMEIFMESASWLRERYNTELLSVKSRKFEYVIASFSTLSGAHYLRTIAKKLGMNIPNLLKLDEIDFVKKGSSILVYMTTTEERNYPNIRLLSQLKELSPIIVNFNTDPLTANIYSMLFSAMIFNKII